MVLPKANKDRVLSAYDRQRQGGKAGWYVPSVHKDRVVRETKTKTRSRMFAPWAESDRKTRSRCLCLNGQRQVGMVSMFVSKADRHRVASV